MVELRKNVIKKRIRPKDSHKPQIQKMIDEGNIQGVIDGLSERQKRFVEQYLVDFNGTAAVTRAGYESKYPNRMAYQLLQNPAIRVAINQMTIDRAEDAVIKPDYVINKVVKTIEKAEVDNNHTAVLRGCELLARHLGMFIERTEISGPNGEAIKYERVKEAADAFTSSIASLIERGTTGGNALISEPRG